MVVPAIATCLLGSRVGKTEAYNSAIATIDTRDATAAAAELLRREATGHGLHIDV